LKSSPDARAGVPDVFVTPFTATTRWTSPGVELHANFLETAVQGNAIRPAPLWAPFALLAAVVLLTALALRNWRPLVGAATVLAIAALLVGGDYLLFKQYDLWLPVTASIFACASLYLAYGGLAFLTEQRRKAEIRNAFSLYVSPEVVDHVMAHPE